MLTYEEMEMITLDMMLGDKVRITGPDAEEFIKAFQADIDLAEKNDWNIELPFDIQELDDPDGGSKRKIVIKKGGPTSGHYGHAGRPGKVGGSAPSSGKGKGQIAGKASPEATTMSQLPHDGNEDVGEMTSNRLPGDRSWKAASYEERGDVKSAVVQGLSERTGIPEDSVNEVIGQWAHSSNDNNLAALELQEAAAEVLGVEMGEWQKAQLDKTRQFEGKDILWFQDREEAAFEEVANIEADWDTGLEAAIEGGRQGEWYQEHRDDYLVKRTEAFKALGQRKNELTNFKNKLYYSSVLSKDQRKTFIQEMYNWTQDDLSNAGIGPNDEISLARGINRDYMDYKVGDVLDYKGNAIESWSLSRVTAGDFAIDPQSGTGMVMAITVPRKNIISTAVTGIGCLIEGEVIISGTVDGHKVRVYDLWQLDEVFDD